MKNKYFQKNLENLCEDQYLALLADQAENEHCTLLVTIDQLLDSNQTLSFPVDDRD